MTLKVGTYNIHNGSDVKWDFSLIAQDILDKDLDVVGIQEVDQYCRRSQRTNTLAELKQYHIQPFGIYVKNNGNIESVVSTLANNQIAPRSIAFDAIAGINKTLTVFIPLFKLIAGGLYIFIIIYLVNYAIQTIKKNYFQIGVLRSFGARKEDVGVIFVTGVVVTGLAIAILSIVFEPLIISVYNTILAESFAMVLNTHAFDINVINVPIWLPIINSAMVVVVTLASALISLLVLKNLKPIEIIRAKDNGGEV